MKNLRAIYAIWGILFGVIIWGIIFLQPIAAFSQDSSETAVSNPLSTFTNSQKIDDLLLNELTESEPNETVRYIVHMAKMVDSKQIVQFIEDQETRHAVLVEQLQTTAQQSQEAVLSDLNSLQKVGSIQSYRSLWIINAVAVEGTPDSVVQLAAHSDVDRITLDEAHPLINQPDPIEQLEMIWQTTAFDDTGDEPWGIDRVRAPYAWLGLGIDGAGITVGIMDSGVDWQHPDLLPNYRGNQGSSINHTGNWYDAIVPTMTVPYDLLGHGTHVAGTAVGQNGIGIAPGASWIAVNITNEYGFIYSSDAHAGFQWLLAPAGNPALAPDIINGSWAGPGFSTDFIPDIEVLDAAGIITVFAASNAGPEAGTIGSPASFAQTIAVGAHDDTNTLTWFSSRGPSPLHDDFHPQIVAPGAAIYSTLPNGMYGFNSGTSMAAPHTTGAVALLLSLDNTLSRQGVTRILTETAVPISSTHPNMNSGWGRLDVYQAVSQIASQTATYATLTGLVREEGTPLSGIVVTITNSTGDEFSFTTDENGRYTAVLRSGTYQLKTEPFNFYPVTINNIPLSANTQTTQNLDLTSQPSGRLIVQVVDAKTNLPIQATIDILGTPLSLETTSHGTINTLIPEGNYEIRVRETGYKIGTKNVTVIQNKITVQTVPLTPSKKVLLIDTGAWYYNSYRTFFEESLINLGYAFDTHIVNNPIHPNFPEQEAVNDYDAIIWTAPHDSPGYIGASNIITDFLGQGGNLFISGQRIGYFDGYGSNVELWWYQDLQADYIAETAVTHTITGALNTHYADLTLKLNSSDSANNQNYIDVSRPRTNQFSEPIFFANSDVVGLQAGLCKPFRLSYTGFGLEGVADFSNRDAILAQTFAYFDTPRQKVGLRWQPNAINDFAPPGDEFVYPLEIQHLGELITDTYSLHIEDTHWPVSLNTTLVELGPCNSEFITVSVSIPLDLPRDFEHDFTITAVSQADPSVKISLPFHYKSPGQILLVDDDRWYNQEEIYQAALTDAGFEFDEWNIGWDNNVKGSPSLSLLNAYNYVIWYTGYDWFAPVTSQENQTLTSYLAQGGRLFLSSQDFLYYNYGTQLTQTYLGIREYQTSITPTHIFRGHSSISTNLAEPLPLTFVNFQNNGDSLTPGPNAEPYVWHNEGMAAGVLNTNSHQRDTKNTPLFRTIFFGFPFEKLPAESRAPLMNNIVGWLSDFGDSTFKIDQKFGPNNESRTYTITLSNNPLADPNQVRMTNTLPISLSLKPASLTGGASYDIDTRQIHWQGQLAGGEEHVITYQAMPNQPLPNGTRIDNPLTITYDKHNLTFNRINSFWINSPDLSNSLLLADIHTQGNKHFITYTLLLENSGITSTGRLSQTIQISEYLHVDKLEASDQKDQLQEEDSNITWRGELQPGDVVTITISAHRDMAVDEPDWLTAVAYLNDGMTNPVIKAIHSSLPPHKYYFPIFALDE